MWWFLCVFKRPRKLCDGWLLTAAHVAEVTPTLADVCHIFFTFRGLCWLVGGVCDSLLERWRPRITNVCRAAIFFYGGARRTLCERPRVAHPVLCLTRSIMALCVVSPVRSKLLEFAPAPGYPHRGFVCKLHCCTSTERGHRSAFRCMRGRQFHRVDGGRDVVGPHSV